MSLLSDHLLATAQARCDSAEAKVVKARAHLAAAEQILSVANAELAATRAAPEIPDAHHSGAHTVVGVK